VTDIALQPDEELVGNGPVAAGDTVRWIIGDTESGARVNRQIHMLIKPVRADLVTNLVINTNRRTYHLELRSTDSTYMASVTWQYPHDQIIALWQQNASRARATEPVASYVDLSRLNFRYAIQGDRTPWRPIRAYETVKQIFIEYPRSITQGEMPPLFIGAPDDKSTQLVNYRVRQNFMIVDTLFSAAELRLGDGKNKRQNPSPLCGLTGGDADVEGNSMKLRPEPPKVTRLSCKMLLTTGIIGMHHNRPLPDLCLSEAEN